MTTPSFTDAIKLTDAVRNDVVFTRAALQHAAHAYGAHNL